MFVYLMYISTTPLRTRRTVGVNPHRSHRSQAAEPEAVGGGPRGDDATVPCNINVLCLSDKTWVGKGLSAAVSARDVFYRGLT